MKVAVVVMGLLREAAARRWFLALGIGVTLMLAVIASALRIEVIDGALAASTLFGGVLSNDIRAVDVALRPVFMGASYVVFYGGLAFGILACADFAPALLTPGRIEHLLAQPIRRWELLAGTYVGVWLLATLAATYGAGGFALILGLKTGVWSLGPVIAGVLASVAFVAIYGVMLVTATFARSAALSAFVGTLFFLAGIFSGYRETVARAFEAGWGRRVFGAFMLPFPRISTLADAAGGIAGAAGIGDGAAFVRIVAGIAVFGVGALAVAVWQVERKDF